MKQTFWGRVSGFIRELRVVLPVALALFAVPEARAITYLKADASEGGDGSSWDKAYRNVEEAVKASESGDKTVYAAGGVYVVTNRMDVVDGFKIYGGFAGNSIDETLENRDVERHQTILTGDRTLDDYWAHVVPVFGEYRTVSTDLVHEPVLLNGAIHFPPPYMGEFDAYQPIFPSSDNNSPRAFRIQAGISSAYDGLWFTGFNGNSVDGNCFDIMAGASETTINDCRFIGNRASHGQIGDNSGKAKITHCQFRFNMTSSRAAGVSMRGSTVVEDCLFESLPRDGANGGGVLYFWSGGDSEIRRCVFSRSITISSIYNEWLESNYGGPGNIVASEGGKGSFIDCVISNTFTASSFERGCPTFAIRDGSVVRCSFINNRYEVKPVGGRAYVVFGNACSIGQKLTYEGCSFRGNVIAAPAVAATDNSGYALGILGNASSGHSLSVVSCTFDSNEVEYVEKPGVTPIFSRALVSWAPLSNTKTELSVVNCTFAGPTRKGEYDIVQYGPAHQTPLIVMNSIFMGDDRSKALSPFYASTPEKFILRDCTIENMTKAPDGFDVAGLQTDSIPFVHEGAATTSHVPVLVPSAKTPGIRETADLATNTPSTLTAGFRYRLRGETDWKPLLLGFDSDLDVSTPLPILDANRNERLFGSYTRGAVQPLTPEAETGHTLLVRGEPYYAGSFSKPSTQAVKQGEPIIPVTAIPGPKSEFKGWYKTDGTLYSSEETLEIESLDDDLVLVAKFGAPKVNVVFDLGKGGTFLSNSSSIISVPSEVQGAFPDVPPYAMSKDWCIYGWDREFPQTVPDSDCVFHAKYVTKDVRIFHVVPEADVPSGSDGSGDSWANATSDLNAIYKDAAIYRGEIWMKGGTYLIEVPLVGKPNVSIYGGFDGTETSVSEADPKAHPTILSGDVAGSVYWKPMNRYVPAEERIPVWTDGVFAEPNPTGEDDYWRFDGQNDSNTALFLATLDEGVTNSVFHGLTFTCFREHVLDLSSGFSDFTVRDCRFLANGYQSEKAPLDVREGQIALEDCEFIGNLRCCNVSSTGPELCTTFKRCVFRENYSDGYGACLRVGSDAALAVEGCIFHHNCAKGGNMYNGAALTHNSARFSRFENCLFQENVLLPYISADGTSKQDPDGVIVYVAYGKSGPAPSVVNCRFISNRAKTVKSNGGIGTCINNISWGIHTMAENCYFASNSVEIAEDVTNSIICAVGLMSRDGGRGSVVNCTVTENEVINHSLDLEYAGIVGGRYGGEIINCLFDDNRFTGPGAEFVWMHKHQWDTFSLVNTVARNDSPAYRPFKIHAVTQSVNFANCAISGIDTNQFAVEPNGFCFHVTSDPASFGRTKTGPDGALLARGISASSPYARAGRPVWRDSDDHFYIYDGTAKETWKTWRQLSNKNWASDKVTGLTLESPPIPDAFGAPRTTGKIAYGPINMVPGGTVLMLR